MTEVVLSSTNRTTSLTVLDKYKDISFQRRTCCMICENSLTQRTIVLPKLPLTEIYIDWKTEDDNIGLVDQEFYVCSKCNHGQLLNVLDQQLLYSNLYFTRTTTSTSSCFSLDVFYEFILKYLPAEKSIIAEIGCNDTYFLNKLAPKALKIFGVDPILVDASIPSNPDIILIPDYIENVDRSVFGGKLDVVVSSHTLEHIVDPMLQIKKLMQCGHCDTLYFFQFPGLDGLLTDGRFDQIFHQHINYFSVHSLEYMLTKLGAEIIDLSINPFHWNSIMVCFKKSSGKPFTEGIFKSNIEYHMIQKQFHHFLDEMRVVSDKINFYATFEKLYGYGAALMLPILNYHLKDALNRIECIIDSDPNKIGKYYINFPKQIMSEDIISRWDDKTVIVTAISTLTSLRGIVSNLINKKVPRLIKPLHFV